MRGTLCVIGATLLLGCVQPPPDSLGGPGGGGGVKPLYDDGGARGTSIDMTVAPVSPHMDFPPSASAPLDFPAMVLNFSELRDLYVRVVVPTMPSKGATLLHLTFINPVGEEFYADTSPFSIDGSMALMSIPGVDHPTSVARATPVRGGYALVKEVPIGGSLFQRFPSDGHWIVRATVDGAAGMISSSFDVQNHR